MASSTTPATTHAMATLTPSSVVQPRGRLACATLGRAPEWGCRPREVPMKALQLTAWKHDPELREVPEPDPGPGEVVVRIGGAGACHSDLHLMHDFDEGAAPWNPPFTLGHENAGWVDAVGAGVTGL